MVDGKSEDSNVIATGGRLNEGLNTISQLRVRCGYRQARGRSEYVIKC